MLAWISPEAGAYAVPIDGAHRITYLDPERTFVVNSNATVFSTIRGRTIEVKNISDARAKAISANSAYLAFRLFLLLFDEEESEIDRAATLRDLEQLTRDQSVVEAAEARLCAYPLPFETEFEKVRRATVLYPNSNSLLTRIRDWQPAIASTRAAFDALSDELFGTPFTREYVEALAVERGLFRSITNAIGEPRKINFALLSAHKALERVNGGRQIVSAWFENLEIRPQREKKRTMLENELADEEFGYGVSGPSARQTYENVKKQQTAVVERLWRGDVDAARRFTRELVSSQLAQHENAEFAAKTLCSLSEQAKNVDMVELQLEWAKRAQDLYPQDARTHGSVADALIALDRFVEAEEALSLAETNGDRRYAAVGRARILRGSGRFEEAYHSFKAAYAEFPGAEGFHALVGAAGSLRDMGSLNEALAEYNQALELYPGEPFLTTGKTITLSELGRWPEALTLANILAQSGDPGGILLHADILRDSGRLTEAIAEYASAVRRFPYLSSAVAGWANALRLGGQFEAALRVMDEHGERFAGKADILALRAEVLGILGRAYEIIPLLERRRLNNALDLRLTSVLTRLYRKLHRETDALSLLDEVLSSRPTAFWLKVERANQIWRLGHRELAVQAYDQLHVERPKLILLQNASASLRASLGEFDKALTILPTIDQPATQEEWRSFILRGVFLTHCRRYKEAVIHLNVLPERVPFYKERRMLVSASAAAELYYGRVNEAEKLIINSRYPANEAVGKDISNVIEFHVLARLDRPDARRILEENEGLSAHLIDLKDQIAKKHGLRPGRPRLDDAQILFAQTSALMLEAA